MQCANVSQEMKDEREQDVEEEIEGRDEEEDTDQALIGFVRYSRAYYIPVYHPRLLQTIFAREV